MNPFATGYAEAIRASLPAEHRDAPFAPATLSRIIADCERFTELHGEWPLAEHGRGFWNGRSSGKHAPDFPPITVTLGDDGLIHLSEAGQ